MRRVVHSRVMVFFFTHHTVWEHAMWTYYLLKFEFIGVSMKNCLAQWDKSGKSRKRFIVTVVVRHWLLYRNSCTFTLKAHYCAEMFAQIWLQASVCDIKIPKSQSSNGANGIRHHHWTTKKIDPTENALT